MSYINFNYMFFLFEHVIMWNQLILQNLLLHAWKLSCTNASRIHLSLQVLKRGSKIHVYESELFFCLQTSIIYETKTVQRFKPEVQTQHVSLPNENFAHCRLICLSECSSWNMLESEMMQKSFLSLEFFYKSREILPLCWHRHYIHQFRTIYCKYYVNLHAPHCPYEFFAF